MSFDFSALNFETIDSNINAYPDMFLNQNGVTFTKKVLEDLGYPAFVLCLLDAKARVFAHRSHSLRSPSFSSLAFSLYREKCPFSIPKTYSCRDEQRAACQYGKEKQTAHRRFYPQKKHRNAT